MANNRLIEEFDHCVTRLANGASIDDCVQLFPQHQDELRVMLEATRIPKKAQISYDEVRYSQGRVQIQFEKALLQSTQSLPRRQFPLQHVASIILLMLFIGSLLTTGIIVVAQDSLPGDTLYPVKRLSEQVQLSIAQDKDTLQATFNQRRIDETKQVIQLKREVDVRFVGVIDRISEPDIYISDLTIEVSEAIQTIGLVEGMRVDISAKTRLDQTLLAFNVRILDGIDNDLQSENRSTSIIETLEPTSTNRIEASPTSSETSITREPSATPRITHEPSAISEATPTEHPSSEPTLTRSQSTAIDSSETPLDCDISPPDGWIRYTIQAGDTPLGIAIGTDISLDQLLNVNCDLNPRLIVVGDVVFVPYEPRLLRTATPTSDAPQVRPTETRPAEVQTIEPIISTPRPTTAPRDVRPTEKENRQTDKSSDQKEERQERHNENNQERQDNSR